MPDHTRLATACGFVAPAVALGAILLATFVASPETFAWHDRALSDMGRPGAETFWLFNGALVAGGLLGAPFVRRVWLATRNRLERAGTVALAVAMAGMVGVGVFFLEHTTYYLATNLHAAAALTVFAGAPAANWLYGAGAIRAGDRRWGRSTIGFGVAHVAAWTAWIAYGRTIATDAGAWFAVPEAVAAALFGGWVVLLARRLWRIDGRDEKSGSKP